MSMGATGGLKRVSNDLELNLQTIESYWTCMAGTEFRPFAKAALFVATEHPLQSKMDTSEIWQSMHLDLHYQNKSR